MGHLPGERRQKELWEGEGGGELGGRRGEAAVPGKMIRAQTLLLSLAQRSSYGKERHRKRTKLIRPERCWGGGGWRTEKESYS